VIVSLQRAGAYLLTGELAMTQETVASITTRFLEIPELAAMDTSLMTPPQRTTHNVKLAGLCSLRSFYEHEPTRKEIHE
jgi:hypothetical protein